jgi:TIR domain
MASNAIKNIQAIMAATAKPARTALNVTQLRRLESNVRDVQPFLTLMRKALENSDGKVMHPEKPPKATRRKKAVQVFLSHVSKEKPFVRKLGHKLSELGYKIWLDEWKIKVGQLIPKEIQDGLRSSKFVVVVLSKRSVGSKWVEREWMAKYWGQVQSGKVSVLPILLQDCEIPELLKGVKYADFRSEFAVGLASLIDAM